MYRSLFLACVSASFVLGIPTKLTKRYDPHTIDTSTISQSDLNIVNYALTLEHLEAAFYIGGLRDISRGDFAEAGFDDSVYEYLQRLATDETTHVDFLSGALEAAGGQPVPACAYKFPYTDAASFVALAAMLEGVGVSAYAGAASSITSGDILTAAASILSVEARHSAVLREAVGLEPYPSPFDSPLSFNQVYSLASQFITSCPYTPPFNVTAFPALVVTGSGPFTTGSTITLQTPGYTLEPAGSSASKPGTGHLTAVFLTPNGPVFVELTQIAADKYTTTVPDGLGGQSYVVLSSCSEALNDATTAAGPAVFEVVPV